MPEIKPVESTTSETLDNALALLERRWAWVLVPAAIVTVAAIALIERLPSQYTSEATLGFVQQQVSQRYVDSPSILTPIDSAQALAREVLTRSKLLGVINELGLYPEIRKKASDDAVAELMRSELELIPLDPVLGRSDLAAFRLQFTADSASKAQAVTSRLTALFIEQDLKTQENRISKTSDFLAEELEGARARLTEQDRRLQAFKVRNLSELPVQGQITMSRIGDLRNQLQNSSLNLNRAQQQRQQLESSISRDLTALETERAGLLKTFTTRHAEVLKKDVELARTRAVLAYARNGAAIPAELDVPAIALQKTQADSILAEIENLNAEQKRLTAEMKQLQSSVQVMPVREQELAALQRDYDLYSKEYSDKMNARLQSQMSSRMSERQEGPQFHLVEPALLPIMPSGPNRLKLSMGGFAVGLAIGMVLAFLQEVRDSSFYSEESLRASFPVPLVLGVPELLTPSEQRFKIWSTMLSRLAAGALILTIAAAEFYVYRQG